MPDDPAVSFRHRGGPYDIVLVPDAIELRLPEGFGVVSFELEEAREIAVALLNAYATAEIWGDKLVKHE